MDQNSELHRCRLNLFVQRAHTECRDDLEQAEHNEPDSSDHCQNSQRTDWPHEYDYTGDDSEDAQEDVEPAALVACTDCDLNDAPHDPPNSEEQDQQRDAAFDTLEADDAQDDSDDAGDGVQHSTNGLELGVKRLDELEYTADQQPDTEDDRGDVHRSERADQHQDADQEADNTQDQHDPPGPADSRQDRLLLFW